jgi:hypothetical protein
MARNPAASRGVEAVRGSEFLCRAVQVRDHGANFDPVHVRYGHEPDSPDPGGPRRAGCQEGIYEEITLEAAEIIRRTGAMISSSFVMWQDGPEGRKVRFVVHLSKQSKHWPKGSVQKETLPEFSLELEREQRMLSFDIKVGYRHVHLAPQMRD